MNIDDVMLRNIQKCELDILKAFVNVCDRLGLMYYLVEGTLLGAVRHQGFIPWDDDIDVAMPRNDYMRFLKEAQQHLPDYYFVQSVDSDPEYHSNIAKVRDSRTTFIELGIKDRAINHGVYIDVFPIDYVPEQKWRRDLIEIQAGIRWIRIVQEFHLPSKQRNWKKRLLGRVVFPYAKLRWPKISDAVRSRDRLFSSCKSSDLMLNFLSMWRKRGVMPSTWYGEGVFMQFEGLTVRVPAQYDQWLSQVYGNYMELPPVEMRYCRHAGMVDLDRSYTEYMNQI